MDTLDEIIKKAIYIGPAKDSPARVALAFRDFVKSKFKIAFIQVKTDREILRLEKLLSSIVGGEK